MYVVANGVTKQYSHIITHASHGHETTSGLFCSLEAFPNLPVGSVLVQKVHPLLLFYEVNVDSSIARCVLHFAAKEFLVIAEQEKILPEIFITYKFREVKSFLKIQR